MTRQALNRKTSLFIGKDRDGETSVIISILTSSCRRNGVDPQRFLIQLIVNLPAVPDTELDKWLTDAWKRREADGTGRTRWGEAGSGWRKMAAKTGFVERAPSQDNIPKLTSSPESVLI